MQTLDVFNCTEYSVYSALGVEALCGKVAKYLFALTLNWAGVFTSTSANRLYGIRYCQIDKR